MNRDRSVPILERDEFFLRPMFKTAKSHRISHNIVEQIRSAILSGELKPGDRLPPEKELAEHFEVSKASLREAFRALEALGFLEVRQGMSGGAFVQKVDLEIARDNFFNYIFFQNPSIHEFTQLRVLLEPKVAEIAARHITDEQLAILDDNLAKTKKILSDRDIPFYYELDTYFHQKICTVTENRLMCFVINSLKNAIVKIKLELELDHHFSVMVYEAHVRIVEALRKRDPDMAGKAMLSHIEEVDRALIAACCDADSPFDL